MISIKQLIKEAKEKDVANNIKQKTIAFVPGSFKPPHKLHEETVQEYSKLADQVIVLISAPTKKPRLTNLRTSISPEIAKQIFELYIKADHLNNVKVDIADKPSPVISVIDYIDKHKDKVLKNSKIILGASTKDDDWKRWTGPFFDKITNELKEYGIEILNPLQTAIDHKTTNLGASDMRDHIDDFEYMQKFFPNKLSDNDRKKIFDMLNIKSESVISEGGNMFDNTTRINLENVADTIASIKSKILPELKLSDKDVKILGSTGKKLPGGSSGDIDVGISYKSLAKYGVTDYKTFVKYATNIFSKLPYEFKNVSKYNIFSFPFPIVNTDGKQPNAFVQVDLMPVDNLEMVDWGFYSPAEKDEKWKGAVRNQLIMKYAGVFDYKVLKTANIDGKEIPVEYLKYDLDRVKGLYRKTLNRLKPDGTLRVVPQVVSKLLVTDDAKKIIKILFRNANFNKFYSTTGTWDEIKKTELFKDKKLRSKMLVGVKAELDRANISYPAEFEKYIEPKSESICEGGRLFGDRVGRINQENALPTIDDLTKRLLIPIGLDDKHFAILGSTGKKLPGGSSGDIDVGIDLSYLKTKTAIKDYDTFRSVVEPMLDKLNVEYRETTARKMVSIVWPIANTDGKQPNAFVQVDLMPVDRLDMVKWGSYAPAEKDNPYKGMIRNELLRQYTTVFKYKVLKKAQINGIDETVEYSKYELDIRYGLFEKTLSREGKDPTKLLKVPKVLKKRLITDDALKIVKILFGNNQTLDNFWTIDTTWEQFKKTDIYKNEELRNVILAKCINEYNRNDVKYPSYMEAAMTDKSLLRKKEVILEGGNAIDGVSRITLKNAKTTIDKAIEMLSNILKLKKEAFAVLGSAGKKAPNETSGDIDIGIDMKQTGFDDVKSFLEHANKILVLNYLTALLAGLNTLSFGFPIENVDNTQVNATVQIDLMPALNFEMLKFGLYSPTYLESKYKGVVRNLLLTDIAGRAKFEVKKVAKDENGNNIPVIVTKYALTTLDGLYEKTFTKEGKNGKILKTPKVLERHLITNDVNKLLKLILTPNTKPEDCLTVDGVWEQFKQTDNYKNPKVRSAILNKTVKELEHRGLDYPSYLKLAIVNK